MSIASWVSAIATLAGSISCGFTLAAHAQIVPDGTLGAETSQVQPVGVNTFEINGGAARGANLFHSFRDFNINNFEAVYFANPTEIETIFSRVTGENPSNILGTLGVLGNADLFLLNPNGILFGRNAQLDVAGSLTATTAESLVFPNGDSFSAVDPSAPPLLTINVTPGLQHGNNPGLIQIRGNLAVGDSLSLNAAGLDIQGVLHAGGELNLQAQNTLQGRDRPNAPLILAAQNDLTLQADQIDIFALNHPDSILAAGGDLTLRSPNPIGSDAHYWSGGNVRFETLDGNPGIIVSPFDPVIRAAGNVSFDTYTGASLHIFAGGAVTANQITITGTETPANAIAETVTLSRPLPDGRNTVAISGSQRPTLDIRAGTTAGSIPPDCLNCLPTNPGGLTFTPGTTADINIGTIQITQPNGLVFLSNQYQPNPALSGNISVQQVLTANNLGGGDVIFDARGEIFLPANSLVQTNGAIGDAGTVDLLADGAINLANNARIQTSTTGAGAGGQIQVVSDSLRLVNGAQFESRARGTGMAGGINVSAAGDVSLAGANTRFLAISAASGVADGGDINIQAGALNVTNGAGIFSSAFGQGQSGEINLDIAGDVLIRGLGGGSNSVISAAGNANTRGGNNVNLTANNLTVIGGAIITTAEPQIAAADANNPVRAGNININLRGNALLDGLEENPRGFGSEIVFTAPIIGSYAGSLTGFTQAGNINIQAESIQVRNGMQVDSSQGFFGFGGGSGGDINLTARQGIDIVGGNERLYSNGLYTSAVSQNSLRSGDITINASQLRIADGAIATTLSRGGANSGQITVNSNRVELINGGQLISMSQGQGSAGNVLVNAQQFDITGRDPRFSDRILFPGSSFVFNQAANSGIFATTEPTSPGDGGNVQLNIQDSLLLQEGVIFADAFGTGNAGHITIRNPDIVQIIPGIISAGTGLPGLVGGGTTGQIEISADQLITDGGVLITSVASNEGDAGDVTVNARNINLNSTFIQSGAIGATGSSGDVTLNSTGLVNLDGSAVISVSFPAGFSLDSLSSFPTESRILSLSEFANEIAQLPSPTPLNPNLPPGSGTVDISAQNLQVQGESLIASSVLRNRRSGDVNIRVTDTVNVTEASRITTDSGSFDFNFAQLFPASGGAGNLTIDTRQLLVENSEISASSGINTTGPAGSLRVNASDSILIFGSASTGTGGLFTGTFGRGAGGNLLVNTANLEVRDGGRIEAGTFGFAPGGNVVVSASNSIRLTGQVNSTLLGDDLIAQFEPGGSGLPSAISSINLDLGSAPAGNVAVSTGELVIENGAQIATLAIERGGTGNGNGGDIQVQADNIRLQTLGQIVSQAEGRGFAGEIAIAANDAIQLDAGGIIASSGASGAGNVDILGRDILLRNGSLISSSVFSSTGGGGNINILGSRSFIAIENSDILANAEDGVGGNISINSPAFLAALFSTGRAEPVGRNPGRFTIFRNNDRVDISVGRTNPIEQNPGSFTIFRNNDRVDISVDSARGSSGQLTLPNVNPEQGLTELPIDLTDPTRLIDRTCDVAAQERLSEFIISGRGGLPFKPEDRFDGTVLLEDLGGDWSENIRPNQPTAEMLPLSSSALSNETSDAVGMDSDPEKPIREAQTWLRDPQGNLRLVTTISTAETAVALLAASCEDLVQSQ